MWFQKPLAAFVQGDSKVMAITGHSGSGKTVLSASVAERLQRAMGRKSFSTLYFSISKLERILVVRLDIEADPCQPKTPKFLPRRLSSRS